MTIFSQQNSSQQGFFLLEALVAILIFAFGILGLIALSSQAISSQSDAEYRTVAANLANEMASTIALGVDRCFNPATCPFSPPTTEQVAQTITTSLAAYAHHPTGATCAFTGAASANANVLAWAAKIIPAAGPPLLPGAADAGLQINIPVNNDPVTGVSRNEVDITVCWKGPKDGAQRHFSLVTYVN